MSKDEIKKQEEETKETAEETAAPEEITAWEERDGQIIIESPLPDHPGQIIINKHLDPYTVIQVLNRAGNVPKFYLENLDFRSYREFYIRFPMFDFRLKDFTPPTDEQLETGRGFPAALAHRCVRATAGLINAALDLKN